MGSRGAVVLCLERVVRCWGVVVVSWGVMVVEAVWREGVVRDTISMEWGRIPAVATIAIVSIWVTLCRPACGILTISRRLGFFRSRDCCLAPFYRRVVSNITVEFPFCGVSPVKWRLGLDLATAALSWRVAPAAAVLSGREDSAAAMLTGRVDPASVKLAGGVDPAAILLLGKVRGPASVKLCSTSSSSVLVSSCFCLMRSGSITPLFPVFPFLEALNSLDLPWSSISFMFGTESPEMPLPPHLGWVAYLHSISSFMIHGGARARLHPLRLPNSQTTTAKVSFSGGSQCGFSLSFSIAISRHFLNTTTIVGTTPILLSRAQSGSFSWSLRVSATIMFHIAKSGV